ncbi:MAG: mechanosensitive ion channel family protein [Cyanobacteriota bacterium]
MSAFLPNAVVLSPFLLAPLHLVVGLAIVAGVFALLRSLLNRLVRRGQPWSGESPRLLLQTLAQIAALAVVTLALQPLPFGSTGSRLLQALSQLVLVVLLVRLANRLVLRLLQTALARLGEPPAVQGLQALGPMIRGLFWLLGSLVFLQNQGVQLTAVLGALAGAGIGIGFALQGPARDFLTYLTILFDQPFVIGDLIRFDDVWGRVIQVGLRSTHLRSLDGERVVITNGDLLAKTLRNYGDLSEKRIITRLVLAHGTGSQAAEEISAQIAAMIDQVPTARFDRCHLVELTPAGLVLELVYLLDINAAEPLPVRQQHINLAILRIFETLGVKLADGPMVGALPGAAQR